MLSISLERAKRLKSETNWLDLPRDVTIQIFIKVGVMELLHTVQGVCSSWRTIAKDPQLYRIIDMGDPLKYYDSDVLGLEPLRKLDRLAIDRSDGQLVDFSTMHFCTNLILYGFVYKSPQLKCLRLAMCFDVNQDCLIEVLQNLPMLEEVEFCLCYYKTRVIEALGRSCPKLKSFRLDRAGVKFRRGGVLVRSDFDEEALTIARNVNTGLRRLQLFGNFMNNTGLEAILDRFPQLEYLDLRQCFNIELEGDLLGKCRRIRELRLPNDLITDYDFEGEVKYAYSSSEDSDLESDSESGDEFEEHDVMYYAGA